MIDCEVAPKSQVNHILCTGIAAYDEIVVEMRSRRAQHASTQGYAEADKVADNVLPDFDLTSTRNRAEKSKMLATISPVADDTESQRLKDTNVGAADRGRAGRIPLVIEVIVGNEPVGSVVSCSVDIRYDVAIRGIGESHPLNGDLAKWGAGSNAVRRSSNPSATFVAIDSEVRKSYAAGVY